MDVFKCHGWLHVALSDLNNIAYIKIDHEDSHIPYISIDILEDVKELIVNNPKWTLMQVSYLPFIPNVLACSQHL